MEFSEFKVLLRSISHNRTSDATFNDEVLGLQIQTAIKYIAKKTVPLKLIVDNSTTVKILRKIDDTTFIRMPSVPSSSASVIDIDDTLLDATARYVMAGYERQMASTHMGLCHQEIDDNNDRLIETEISTVEVWDDTFRSISNSHVYDGVYYAEDDVTT